MRDNLKVKTIRHVLKGILLWPHSAVSSSVQLQFIAEFPLNLPKTLH